MVGCRCKFNNPANPEVHERTTGAEIIAAFGETGLDAFVGGVGTGGTIISGVSHALKKLIRTSKSTQLEADESAILSGEKPGPHKIQDFQLIHSRDLDTAAYNGIVRVTSDQALEFGRYIGGQEGFLVGNFHLLLLFSQLLK